MPDILLQELYQWARSQLDQPIMFGYRLYKVNGQIPDSVSILLKQPGSRRPNAEIQIEFTPNRAPLYQASFNFLPSNTKLPRPDQSRISVVSHQEVIHWLKTGQKRI